MDDMICEKCRNPLNNIKDEYRQRHGSQRIVVVDEYNMSAGYSDLWPEGFPVWLVDTTDDTAAIVRVLSSMIQGYNIDADQSFSGTSEVGAIRDSNGKIFRPEKTNYISLADNGNCKNPLYNALDDMSYPYTLFDEQGAGEEITFYITPGPVGKPMQIAD